MIIDITFRKGVKRKIFNRIEKYVEQEDIIIIFGKNLGIDEYYLK